MKKRHKVDQSNEELKRETLTYEILSIKFVFQIQLGVYMCFLT